MKVFLAAFFLFSPAFFFVFPATCGLAASLDSKVVEDTINGYRKSQGLKPLKENPRLRRSSTAKAEEMVAEGYFGHTSPNGEPFYASIQKVEYSYSETGEIIARGCQTEKCLLNIWANSPPHRQIILNPKFQDIGCGIQVAGPEDHFFAVCHFGRPSR